MKQYKPRVVDALLTRKLEGKGAVLIEGAKWCGKTTTAEQVARSVLYMDDPEKIEQNLALAELSPKKLLLGDTPRLLDEWQLAPKLWDAIRFEADHRDELGQFILTGSAVPPSLEKVRHSGTGRFAWLKMRPMSLYESGESNGEVSLKKLFTAPKDVSGTSSLDLSRLAFLTCRGGWPRAVSMSDRTALEQAFDYYDAVVNTDISRVEGMRCNPETAKRLMRSYARHQGAQAATTVICEDLKANENSSPGYDTISNYLNALKKIFVIEDMPAWNPNLRSKTAIRTSDTRYFTDPSIATASLGLGPDDLIADLKTFGLLFETLCVRDLRVFAEALDGQVYHYRDRSGLECDAVVHLRNGSYGLIEIKLGGEKLISEGAANLLALSGKIDADKMKRPSFQMVLTGIGDYAYRRKDDVYVVPIGCIKQ